MLNITQKQEGEIKMIYLPNEKWSEARKSLYTRLKGLQKFIATSGAAYLLSRRQDVAKKVGEMAESLKDHFFACDEVASWTEEEFKAEKERLTEYINSMKNEI